MTNSNSTSNTSPAFQKYTLLKEKVFQKRPLLKEILEKYGHLSLYEYAKLFYRKANYPQNKQRKEEFIAALRLELEKIYGKEVAEKAAKQFSLSFHAGNTEHHGPIGTPRQLNNILITSLPFTESPNENFPINPIIACSNISFSNWTFPRGFMFHTFTKRGLNENQLVFHGHGLDAYPLWNTKSYDLKTIEALKKTMYTMWNEKYMGKKEYNKLLQIVDEIFAEKSVLESETYTDQSEKINYLLWKKIFSTFGYASPDLIFIEQEKLANYLIAHHHLNEETLIHRILFDEKSHTLLKKYFEGIICGFNEATQHGTYLFWGTPKGTKQRTQLWKKGNELVAPDNSYRVKLTPQDIAQAIENKEIIPSTLLCFILFCFYYGLRQIGGPNQTTFLTQMKEAFIAMQTEYGDMESVENCKDLPTTDFLPGNPPILAFLEDGNGVLTPATPLDLLLYGNSNSIVKLIELSKKTTLEDSVSRTFPLWYKRCYGENEREADLASITESDIDKITGLDKKISAFARIEMNRVINL